MAGIYVHIPYCKKACHYCDFAFSTSLSSMDLWVNSLLMEIKMQKIKLGDNIVETLYFGGGTPSLLPQRYWTKIVACIHENFSLQLNEFTIESNPENLTIENLFFWKSLGCNRLSIGVQSFQDNVLKWMNRNHNAKMAHEGIKRANKVGFENISVDFIYNIPIKGVFEKDLSVFLDLELPHYSAYTLTIETQTVFYHQLNNGELSPISESQATNEMDIINHMMTNKGYEHYEISNFALPQFRAIHNSNYWKHIPYLGLGTASHSFIQNKRWYNVKNNWHYIKKIKENKQPIHFEERLSPFELLNEKIMFGLRTMEGFNLQNIENNKLLTLSQKKQFYRTLNVWNNSKHIYIDNQQLILSRKGVLIADSIIEDLFIGV